MISQVKADGSRPNVPPPPNRRHSSPTSSASATHRSPRPAGCPGALASAAAAAAGEAEEGTWPSGVAAGTPAGRRCGCSRTHSDASRPSVREGVEKGSSGIPNWENDTWWRTRASCQRLVTITNLLLIYYWWITKLSANKIKQLFQVM